MKPTALVPVRLASFVLVMASCVGSESLKEEREVVKSLLLLSVLQIATPFVATSNLPGEMTARIKTRKRKRINRSNKEKAN
jgi:hypothetical protein